MTSIKMLGPSREEIREDQSDAEVSVVSSMGAGVRRRFDV